MPLCFSVTFFKEKIPTSARIRHREFSKNYLKARWLSQLRGNWPKFEELHVQYIQGRMGSRVSIWNWQVVQHQEDGLFDKQFEFRKRRSTIDAMYMTGLAKAAKGEGKCRAVITLDVKNALDTAKWKKIKALIKLSALKYALLLNFSWEEDCAALLTVWQPSR